MSLRPVQREPKWVQYLLTLLALGILGLLLLVPLFLVFSEAFRKGWEVYLAALTHKDAKDAIFLTLFVALISLPINVIIGVSAAWLLTKFNFRGKSLLLTLLDLPFAVSPVVAGLTLILVYGQNGWFGGWLEAHGIQVIFAPLGMIIATLFITFPFIARELIPLMESQGNDPEYAALSLGAKGWRTFWKVTMPNMKWALFYGIILCNARAMGEFGAVSVVSAHLRGKTVTLPLHIEILYNEYQFAAAFAAASVLALLAIVTLFIKTFLESRMAEKH